MGSQKYITKKEAAELLRVTERTVTRYLDKGLLSFEYRGKVVYMLEEDVLRLDKGRKDPAGFPLNQDTFEKMQVEIDSLKSQMAVVLRILNLRHMELTLNDAEYKNLYDGANQLASEGWPPHVEEQWSDLFLRLRVEDFERIEPLVDDPHPWRSFLRLATSMHLKPWDKNLREVFAEGKKRLEQVAGMWCVLRGESSKDFDMLSKHHAAPFKPTMRRMKRSQAE
jgi:DNA-binding transcriptional MerR regulator